MLYSELAMKYKGVVQWSRKHKNIIDYYNENVKPLPRGYKVSYNDSWCATFVSFILAHFKTVNPPYECSANRMWEKCKKNKQIVKKPRVDDVVFYSWNCNGYINHVGIIAKVDADYITVIEGNKSRKVDTRTIRKDSMYIQGFARVKKVTK